MINKLGFSLAIAFLLCFTSQSKADWYIDFAAGSGLSEHVTNFSFNPGANFTGTLGINHATGHTWTTNGVGGQPDSKATIRYEFQSLYDLIQPSVPGDLVSFAVPLASDSSEGVFSIVGTAEREFGGSYTFTNDSGGTPLDPNGDFEWITGITLADLAADDIVALNFEITFDYGGGVGLDQVFTFGGPKGLTAAPEPTSAVMIGCALVGLVARRRRKV